MGEGRQIGNQISITIAVGVWSKQTRLRMLFQGDVVYGREGFAEEATLK